MCFNNITPFSITKIPFLLTIVVVFLLAPKKEEIISVLECRWGGVETKTTVIVIRTRMVVSGLVVWVQARVPVASYNLQRFLLGKREGREETRC